MEYLLNLSPLISIVAILLIYVIRTEQKIKNLEMERDLLEKINFNEKKVLELDSKLSSEIIQINERNLNTDRSLSEIKSYIQEIFKLINEGKRNV